METNSIYEMLKNGATPEDITKALNDAEKQLKEEKAREEAEKAKAAERDAALDCYREELSTGLYNWATTLGIYDGDYETFEPVIMEALKETEKEISYLMEHSNVKINGENVGGLKKLAYLLEHPFHLW